MNYLLCSLLAMAPGMVPPGTMPPGAMLPGTLVSATDSLPACTMPVTIWLEDFTLPDGTTSDAGATAWSETNNSPHGVFGVVSNEFKVNDITVNGEGVWSSAVIDISGKSAIQLSVDVRSMGDLENDATNHSDYLRLYYKLDGGAEVLFADL